MRTGALAARAVAALAGGALVAAALAPVGIWPLALIGCGTLVLSLSGTDARSRLLCATAFGVGQLSLGLLFILQFSALGYVALVVGQALFFGAAAALVPPSLVALALPAALCVAEWCREHFPFGGLPPGGLPLAGAASPFAPLARLGGPALVSLVLIATGAALAELARAVGVRGRSPWWPLAALASLVALTAVSAAAPDGGPARSVVRAAAVQGGGVRGLDAIAAPSTGALVRTAVESARVPSGVGLIVWPEDTVPLAPGAASPGTSALGRDLGALARQDHTTLLAGVTEAVGSSQFLNAEAGWDPSGRYAGEVEKAHAVPFGEYVPLRGLLRHFVSFGAVPRDAIEGHNDGLLRTAAGPLGVVISYEAFYPGRGAEAARAGAQVLVLPTNTASYASAQVPAQELAATRLLAIATGRDVLQAATAGYSALVTPDGAVHDERALSAPGLVVVDLARRGQLTIFDRAGEWPTLALCGALVAGARLAARRRQRRPRGSAERPEPPPIRSRVLVGAPDAGGLAPSELGELEVVRS